MGCTFASEKGARLPPLLACPNNFVFHDSHSLAGSVESSSNNAFFRSCNDKSHAGTDGNENMSVWGTPLFS